MEIFDRPVEGLSDDLD